MGASIKTAINSGPAFWVYLRYFNVVVNGFLLKQNVLRWRFLLISGKLLGGQVLDIRGCIKKL